MYQCEVVAMRDGKIVDVGSCYCYDPKAFRKRHKKMRCGMRSDYWGTKSLWISFGLFIVFVALCVRCYFNGGVFF